MFKSFVKVFVVSMIVVAMTAPVAFATTARVNSLAGTGDYLNDDSNVFRWYATLPSYSNLVMAEVGSFDGYSAYDQALGFTYACGEDGAYGTWGIFLMSHLMADAFYSQVSHLAPPMGDDIPGVPVNKFAIHWGKELDGLAIGLAFTRSDKGEEDTTPDDPLPASPNYNISYTTLGAGLRTDVGENAYADFAVTMGLAGGGMTDSTEFDKKMSLNFAGRMFWEWKEYATIIPVIDFGMYEFALDNGDPYSGGHGEKGNWFNVGFACNMDVNTNNMLLFGVEVAKVKYEPSLPDTSDNDWAETSFWVLPSIFLGLETDVKPWLTVRMAARKTLWKDTEKEIDGGEDMETGADFDWFLGCGFHVAEFDIDCEVGPEAPFSLGYWMTGNSAYDQDYYGWNDEAQPSVNAPITRISATYHF